MARPRLLLPKAATIALIATTLAACSTLGDSGPAICHGTDGTMVPVNDSRCPQAVRDVLQQQQPQAGPALSIPQSIANQQYDAANGLVQGDPGFRPF